MSLGRTCQLSVSRNEKFICFTLHHLLVDLKNINPTFFNHLKTNLSNLKKVATNADGRDFICWLKGAARKLCCELSNEYAAKTLPGISKKLVFPVVVSCLLRTFDYLIRFSRTCSVPTGLSFRSVLTVRFRFSFIQNTNQIYGNFIHQVITSHNPVNLPKPSPFQLSLFSHKLVTIRGAQHTHFN